MDFSPQNWAHFTTPLEGLATHSIACVGAGEQRGSWRGFRGRRLASSALVVISSGSGWYVDSSSPAEISIDGPTAMWLAPGVKHGYGPSEAGWVEHWIVFTGNAVAAYAELGVRPATSAVMPLVHGGGGISTAADGGGTGSGNVETVVSHFGPLRQWIQDASILGQMEASLLVQRILVDVIRCRAEQDELGASGNLLQRFVSHAFESISMAERARRLGLSVDRLRDGVAQLTGSTPLEYLLDHRVARACELLTSTEESISRVARQVGYADPAYFSRLFTLRVGVSPRSFRDQQSRNPLS
ncbi:helix-turn-helix domain-containing protein [Nakamurella antarctica]|nr:AraC family transcriptional regulator [Nakamurella antarctica]